RIRIHRARGVESVRAAFGTDRPVMLLTVGQHLPKFAARMTGGASRDAVGGRLEPHRSILRIGEKVEAMVSSCKRINADLFRRPGELARSIGRKRQLPMREIELLVRRPSRIQRPRRQRRETEYEELRKICAWEPYSGL